MLECSRNGPPTPITSGILHELHAERETLPCQNRRKFWVVFFFLFFFFKDEDRVGVEGDAVSVRGHKSPEG